MTLVSRRRSPYCEKVKNVTVSLDDDTYRQARRRAAEADRSLSSVVREYLQNYGTQESEFDRLARREKELRAELSKRPGTFGVAGGLSRDELYDRSRARYEAENGR